MHVTLTRPLSVEEYMALPECKPYLEYVGGEAVPKMAPAWEHFVLAGRLLLLLGNCAAAHGGWTGPEGRVEFDDGGQVRFLLPDVAYYGPGSAPRGPRAMTPPTLAIEIRSADESIAAQREKCHFYVTHGVVVAVLVDPQNGAIEVFERGGHLVHETPAKVALKDVPGLEFRLAELFEGLLESS